MVHVGLGGVRGDLNLRVAVGDDVVAELLAGGPLGRAEPRALRKVRSDRVGKSVKLRIFLRSAGRNSQP